MLIFACYILADHLNPELIWNQDCRDRLTEAVIDMCNRYIIFFSLVLLKVVFSLRKSPVHFFRFNRQQEKNRALKWSLPDAFAVSYASAISATLRAHNLTTSTDNEDSASSLDVVCIGGVYLQLYVSQAAGRWMLRQPEVFLEALMTRLIELLSKKEGNSDGQLLRLVSRAALQLLGDRPGLLDGLPKKGFVHRILDLFPSVREPEEARTCALLIHAMSFSKVGHLGLGKSRFSL